MSNNGHSGDAESRLQRTLESDYHHGDDCRLERAATSQRDLGDRRQSSQLLSRRRQRQPVSRRPTLRRRLVVTFTGWIIKNVLNFMP